MLQIKVQNPCFQTVAVGQVASYAYSEHLLSVGTPQVSLEGAAHRLLPPLARMPIPHSLGVVDGPSLFTCTLEFMEIPFTQFCC